MRAPAHLLPATAPARIACLALALALGACGESRAHGLREWRPSDHQPPPDDQAGEQPTADETTAAAALWQGNCAPCHGAEGHGDGPSKPPIAQVPDLSDPSWQASRSDEELTAVITNGRGMMPAFGSQVSPTGVEALVGYVRSLGGAAALPAPNVPAPSEPAPPDEPTAP